MNGTHFFSKNCSLRYMTFIAILALTVWMVLSRFVMLDAKPLMHDESLFAYYAWHYTTFGSYTHLPILHGPVLMLFTGTLFEWFGESIGVARAWIAIASWFVVICGAMLTPKRVRLMAAILLATSPILLYYSRFLRDDLLFCGVAALGIMCFSQAFKTIRPYNQWISFTISIISATTLLFLIAVMENALFIYASAITFLAVIAVCYRITQGRVGLSKNFQTLRFPLYGFLLGCILGIGVIIQLYGVLCEPATPEGNMLFKRPIWIWNLAQSWIYWNGQHRLHRLSGPIHYYIPILLVYELPVLLILVGGLFADAIKNVKRTFAYLISMFGWLCIWGTWRLVRPEWFYGIEQFLHFEPDTSMLILGFIITPILVWSLIRILNRYMLAGWCGWWTACSLFQYSTAGEKVPWLAVHIMMPLILMTAWIGAETLKSGSKKRLLTAWILMILIAFLNIRNDLPLIGSRNADPRECIIFNHTTQNYADVCNSILAQWDRIDRIAPSPDNNVSKQRKIFVIEDPDPIYGGGPAWPSYWYFRNHNCQQPSDDDSSQTLKSPTWEKVLDQADLILGAERIMEDAFTLNPEQWHVYRLSLRDAWVAEWPPKGERMKAWWRYYWQREIWSATGGFDLIAIEPVSSNINHNKGDEEVIDDQEAL